MSWSSAFPFSNSLTARLSPSPAWLDVPEQQEQQQDEEGESASAEVVKEEPDAAALAPEDRWSAMLPELLADIVRRVEASEGRWPLRKSVVSCACVCRRWREITTGLVGPPGETGNITFPSSLKQPGTRDLPIQCFVRRNKKRSTFYLFLSLTQTFMDKGKFLLAARRFRHGSHAEYIISLDADDLSQGSNAYVGKLRSDFLGTKFTIYDRRSPYGIKASSNQVTRSFSSKKISPHVPACNFEIGQVAYKFNLMKTRAPRRMLCTMQCPVSGNAEQEEPEKMSKVNTCRLNDGFVVLKNKAPRWHEHLQCWCLNFHGRVSVASVKNFQLVATSDPSRPGNIGDEETVILQFGKIGKDIFTMDYREPLSAFQAFAICLTSFGTKFACE